MSFYRIYRYPRKLSAPFKHVYFKGKRPGYADRTRKEGDRVRIDGKYMSSLYRAKRRVRDIILCNDFDYFCTFTFDSRKVDRYDLALVRKKLSTAFNNYKKRYSADFAYCIVPELHKDGAVHFHGVVRGIRKTDLVLNANGYLDWPYYRDKFGYFSAGEIRNYEACARYVAKYITKDIADLPKNWQIYLCSKGLKQPVLDYDVDGIPQMFDASYDDRFVAMAFKRWDFTSQFYGGFTLPGYDDGADVPAPMPEPVQVRLSDVILNPEQFYGFDKVC